MNTCKKNILLISVIILTSFILFPSCKKEKEKEIDIKITTEYLTSTAWGQEGALGLSLNFNKAGKYDGMNAQFQYADPVKGSYEIINNKLNLYKGETKTIFIKDGILKTDQTSIKYQNFLIFPDGTKLWDKNLKVKTNSIRIIDGSESIVMGIIDGETTTNVKIRVKPDEKAEAMKYIDLIDSTDSPVGKAEKDLPSVPKGKKISILARTKDKVKVQNWNNYWYYVEISEGWGTIKNGWMFAEFVKLKK